MSNNLVVPSNPPSPVVDAKTGQLTFAGIKWFQNIAQAVNNGLTLLGNFIGQLTQETQIEGRSGTLGTITQNLDDSGVVTAQGIDFTRPYLNKTTDNIADGTGNPLAGGKSAYTALVASGPIAGRSLIYNGSQWLPEQVNYSNVSGTPILPGNAPGSAHQWLQSYNAGTGSFALSQPDFSDLTGTATAGQVPALNALNGAITTAQLPADVAVVSFGSGAPSGVPPEGYTYYDTSVTPYQGYVFHAGAWNKIA